jgi:hypothetical protein
MWPSEETAERLYNWANIGLIFSLAFGVVSTVLVVWMGNVKEGYSEAELKNAEDRLGKAEIEAGCAAERAAIADLKRAELQSRILDLFGQRHLTPQQSAYIVKGLAGLKGAKVDVYVFKFGSPYNSTEFSDDSKLGAAVVYVLQGAGLDAEGWLLESCQSSEASNLVVGVIGESADDRKAAEQVLKSLPAEIGVWPEITQNFFPQTCSKFSDLNPSRPNKRTHDAKISIAIGRKTQPILTREMLEVDNEQDKPSPSCQNNASAPSPKSN